MKIYALFVLGLLSLSESIQSTVHVFGDSHAYYCFSNAQVPGNMQEQSLFCFNTNEQSACIDFFIHYLGPVTMHRVGRDGFGILNINRFVQEDDTVVFVFGEIDVRCHIGKQRDEYERCLGEVISTLVNKYMATISQNVKQYARLKVVILGSTPPCDIDPALISLPVHGSLHDRAYINNALCDELARASKERGYYFLDIRPNFSNHDGSLAFELSDGSVHVGLPYNRIIKEKLLALIECKN